MLEAAAGSGARAAEARRSWRSVRRRAGAVALAAAVVVLGLWLAQILGWVGESAAARGQATATAAATVSWGEALARFAIVAAVSAGAVWLAAGVLASLAGLRGRARAAALLLPGVLVLALVVRFAGIDSEVSGRYYLDEGTYYHHATAINDGDVLRPTFVYPHLLYYTDALTLWAAGRFPALVAGAARRLYGLDEPLAVAWVLLRSVVALLSALTVVPVYRIAERLAGPSVLAGRTAGVVAGVLLAFSSLFNEGSHLNTCDVPSAFFATLCLFCVMHLLDGERRRWYVVAGVAAGLAAASKYPAGVVCVAIAAVWLGWRWRRRDWDGGLAWAALASVVTVVAVMPSLLAFPALAFTGQRGIFFGVHQYGTGGWLGVLPASNAAFYLGKALESFGWPAAVVGLSGLLPLAWRDRGAAGRGVTGAVQGSAPVTRVTDRSAGAGNPGDRREAGAWRRAAGAGVSLAHGRLARLLWLAPFPVAYLFLIDAMNMVVKRNLYPVLPILSAYLGAGIAGWVELAASRAPMGRRRLAWGGAAALIAAGCLWLPATQVAAQTVGYLTPGTREEALAWIRRHVPPGASIVKESYTPDFPAGLFEVTHERFAGRIPIDDLRNTGNDYLLLSSAAYSRFQDAAALFTENQRAIAGRYLAIFKGFPLLQEWDPDDYQLGPVLRLYRIDPVPASCSSRTAEVPAADAFVPDSSMRPGGEGGGPLRFASPGQWAMFHACLPAGRYRLALRGHATGPGRLREADVAGTQLAVLDLRPEAGGGASVATTAVGALTGRAAASGESTRSGEAAAPGSAAQRAGSAGNVASAGQAVAGAAAGAPAAGAANVTAAAPVLPTPSAERPPVAWTADLDVARAGKVLLYVYLPLGSRLRSLSIEPPTL